jgi:hypothetical protein
MSIPVSNCTTFVQVWVDTNALQNGSEQGIYVVDNQLNNGSQNEGTPNLSTQVTNHTNICWHVYNIDPNSTTQLAIQSIGNSAAFGASGQPESAGDGSGAFTGQVQATGSASYTLNFTAQKPNSSGITAQVSPQLNVS